MPQDKTGKLLDLLLDKSAFSIVVSQLIIIDTETRQSWPIELTPEEYQQSLDEGTERELLKRKCLKYIPRCNIEYIAIRYGESNEDIRNVFLGRD